MAGPSSSSSDSSETGDLLSNNGNGANTTRASNPNVGSTANPVDAVAAQIAGLIQSGSTAYLTYSPSILVSLRAPTVDDTTNTNSSSLYTHLSDYYDFEASDNDDRVLQPHVYEMAIKAYYYLRRTNQDQAIVFHSATSTTATGQNEQRRLATRALLSVASSNPAEQTSKSVRIAKQIQAAEFIVDAFGCTGTGSGSGADSDGKVRFPAPRFGRYAELQFSDGGRIVGYKALLHGLDLDTGRIGFALDGVNGVQNKERSFEAVRWLVRGATQDERDHLKLPNLNGSEEDNTYSRERFGLLKQAFKTFGFPKRAVASLCSTLAAILHISSLQFSPSSSSDHDAGCTIATPETLHTIAALLGLLDNPATAPNNLKKLEEAFTNKTAYVDGEKCTVVLDIEKANDYKEQVAKVLYKLVWEWLGEFVNQKLCREDFSSFIALVDFPALSNQPGHRNEGNSLSTLCLNMASERLASFISSNLFLGTSADTQAAEGIRASFVARPLAPAPTVAETVRVITTSPGGLVHIIDDQSVRKGKNERTMLDAMGKRWGKNRQFTWRKETDSSAGTRAGTFTIEHWSDGETITYSTENFLERNLNLVPNDLVDLLGGKAVAQVSSSRRASRRQTGSGGKDKSETTILGGSANPFVRELFANEVVAAAENEKATMGIGSSQSEKAKETEGGEGALSVPGAHPSRKPSMRRKASTRKADEAGPAAGGLKRGKTIAVKRLELLAQRCVLGNFGTALNELFETLSESCRLFFVFCLAPNTAAQPGIDARFLKSQIRALQLVQIRERCAMNIGASWTQEMDFREFWDRYNIIERWQGDLVKRAAGLMWTAKMEAVKEEMEWADNEFAIGKGKVFLNHAAFRQMEDYLRTVDQDEQKKKREFSARSAEPEADPYSPFSRPAILLANPGSPGMPPVTSPFQATTKPYNHPAYAQTTSTAFLPLVAKDPFAEDDDRKTFLTDDEFSKSRLDMEEGGLRSPSGAISAYGGLNDPDEKVNPALAAAAEVKEEKETVEVYKETRARRQWKFLVWCFTWWIPSPALKYIGGMKRPDVRMAWREKVTIFMLIGLLCGSAVFVIAILGNLICPKEYVYTTAELEGHSYSNNQDNMLVNIRGEVFDLTNFANVHYPSIVPIRSVQRYGGLDASNIFPVQVSALCNGKEGTVSPWVTLDTSNTTDPNAVYHDFRAATNDSRPDWYWEQMVYLRYNYRRGFMGFTSSDVDKRSKTVATRNTVIYGGNVYDMSGYITNNGGGLAVPAGQAVPPDTDRQFMHDAVVQLFQQYAGQDITSRLDSLGIDPDQLAAQRVCLRNLFFIGKTDTRNSVQCQFSRYILLAFSILMVTIIGFKFLAALQFGRARQPENHDRFVVLQVPCYTEGEDSLRECFESLASLKYDDKRKLLFVICDGMIIGSGNDRPTPRIVLDILGADPALDPEPLSFHSLGEGNKQHNMGKVYSGLYEHAGHVIPYIVMVKVGKPSERSRPGNRGKRDSQMVLMRFFNRVHFDSPMAPCELELFHQIKNVIGVNPTFYEFLLAIDADTVVDPLALNRFISAMVHDRKVIATCGETELSNSKSSMISMMQVYEYFISHHLAKAFESLFGSVTCLPGCFSLYRLRTVENKPVFIANDVVIAFGENRVDTLHMKNLLHLGEDRYLTTLLLKNFPNHKLTFTRDAHARTIAPEEWSVLLSQRRRWINSTIHNLAELIGRVDRLCGFCCCSMRAIVLVDLLSTLIQPVTVAYIVYLIYLVAGEGQPLPTLALIMLGAIYGLQAVIFLLHRKFEMIVWMLIYILAIPVFSFALPVYSFWKQDDFSWGQTRVVLGEQGKKLVIHDEGEFDPKSIPLKSWQEYENELWEKGSNASIGQLLAEREEQALLNGGDGGYGHKGDGSIYGHESVMGFGHFGGMGSRPRTPASELGARSFHQALNSLSGVPPVPGYGTPGGVYPSSRADSVYHGASPYHSGGYGSQSFNAAHLQQMQMQQQYELQQGGGGMGEMGQNPFMPTHQSYQSLGGQSMPLMQQQVQPLAPGQLPSDEQLEMDIRGILARADLQNLTKKGVREELEQLYGVDLTSKKAFINEQIEQALSNLY